MTKEDFAKAMSFLGMAYDKEFEQKQVEVWFTFFHQEEFQDFKQAVTRLISKSKFLPSIAEVKQEIALIKNPVLQLNAEDEWSKVQLAIRKHGQYSPREGMESLEPQTQRVVRMMGGFQAICQSTEGDWLRKNFVSLFNELAETNQDALQLSEPQMTLAELKRIAEVKEKERLMLEGQI